MWLCLQDKAYSYQEVDVQCNRSVPVPSGVLTPPLSSEKMEDCLRMDASVPPKIRAMMSFPAPHPISQEGELN